MNAHMQLREWCKEQAHTGRKLIALTPGRMLPRREHPTLAMCALGTILTKAFPGKNWMNLPMPDGASDLHPWFQSLACQDFPKQAVTIGFRGEATPAIGWVFCDSSALLTAQHGNNLRIFPGSLWLKSREIGWTPSVLIGKKDGGPRLRITHSRVARSQAIHEENVYASEALCADFAAMPGGIAREIQRDIDAMYGVFDATKGSALWPEPGKKPQEKWPPFLPHRGFSPEQAHAFAEHATHAAKWLICALHSWGTPVQGIDMQRNKGILDALCTESTGRTTLARFTYHTLPTFFPPLLCKPLQDMLASPPGLAYRFTGGAKPEAQDWHPLRAAITLHPSRHTILQAFAQWGQPPITAKNAWGATCA